MRIPKAARELEKRKEKIYAIGMLAQQVNTYSIQSKITDYRHEKASTTTITTGHYHDHTRIKKMAPSAGPL